jgi:hypothetical protein
MTEEQYCQDRTARTRQLEQNYIFYAKKPKKERVLAFSFAISCFAFLARDTVFLRSRALFGFRGRNGGK